MTNEDWDKAEEDAYKRDMFRAHMLGALYALIAICITVAGAIYFGNMKIVFW